jgi:hypothetical protein
MSKHIYRHLKNHLKGQLTALHEGMRERMPQGDVDGAFTAIGKRHRLLREQEDLDRVDQNEINRRGR